MRACAHAAPTQGHLRSTHPLYAAVSSREALESRLKAMNELAEVLCNRSQSSTFAHRRPRIELLRRSRERGSRAGSSFGTVYVASICDKEGTDVLSERSV